MRQTAEISLKYKTSVLMAIGNVFDKRYGFNGKEIDKGSEGMGGGGSTYDYGFRIYNPNLGKFLSVDPLSASYPCYTPYQFAGNKPINCVDLDGLEEACINENTPSTEPNSNTSNIENGISFNDKIKANLPELTLGSNDNWSFNQSTPSQYSNNERPDKIDDAKADWSKTTDADKIVVILNAIHNANKNHENEINIRNLFNNVPQSQSAPSEELIGNIKLGNQIILVHISIVVIYENITIGSTFTNEKQIDMGTKGVPVKDIQKKGLWYRFKHTRVNKDLEVLEIQVLYEFEKLLKTFLYTR